jgi:hypothetical protein
MIIGREKLKCLEKKQTRCHLVHHKSHTDCPWIETSNETVRQRRDYVNESLHVAKCNYNIERYDCLINWKRLGRKRPWHIPGAEENR